MEAALLPKAEEKRPCLLKRVTFVEELKKVSYMAAPMAMVSVSQYLQQVVSLMLAGHLGELSLSGISIATSFCNVTGFSLLFGLAGGLETLCGQAYGAGQYQKVGTYTYCAAVSLIPVCILISVLWIFMDKLLILIGQDPQISIVACEYAIYLIPALFGCAILQSLVRYFQSQSLIFPMLLSSFATLCLHVPLCWALVYKWELGRIGAAISIGFSCWLNVILLGLYMGCSSSCQKTRTPYWENFSLSITEFFRFAVPSALMVCLEWWTFELLVFLAGLLPNSQLETSVLSICLSTTSLNYFVQSGIAAATSTRVSNELGARNARAARGVVVVALIISLTEAVIVSTILFFCRHVFGYAYSNVQEVVDYVTEVSPLLSLSFIVDGLLALFAGVTRGCGWQHIAAFINLGAYYFVGIPVSVLLCFVLHLRGKGLWIGILIGSSLQLTSLALITAMTNWEKQVTMTRDRIFKGRPSADINVAVS